MQGKKLENIFISRFYVKLQQIYTFQAWLVMICAFLCNGVIFGIHNSGGSLFVDLKEKYGEDSSKGALVVSLGTGATFGLSAISSLLADKYGIQKTALFGAILAFLGMLLSAFAVNHVRL